MIGRRLLKMTSLSLALLTTFLLLSPTSQASGDYQAFVWSLEPVGSFDQPGEIEMEMRLDIDTAWCHRPEHIDFYDLPNLKLDIHLLSTGGLRVVGDTAIVLSLSGGPLETLRFRVLVPDDTVSSVEVTQKSTTALGVHYWGRAQRYFVTTADTCEYRGGSPHLSAAALQTRMPKDTSLYRVKVDLSNPETYEAAL